MADEHSALLRRPDELAKKLAGYAIQTDAASVSIQESQLVHRLDLFKSWYGSLEEANSALSGKNVVEIGCGQGDMTIAIASLVSPGKVYGIDPAPLDYGSPFTLAQAQGHLSQTPLGRSIEWIQADPLDALRDNLSIGGADTIILAHSSFYFESKDYMRKLLGSIANSKTQGRSKTLLFAEWGMKTSVPEANPHLLAVRAQALQPFPTGNIRTVIPPNELKELAREVGWKVDKEAWIEAPKLDDGGWEVGTAKTMRKLDSLNKESAALLDEMESQVKGQSGRVKCMDVWTCAFTLE